MIDFQNMKIIEMLFQTCQNLFQTKTEQDFALNLSLIHN